MDLNPNLNRLSESLIQYVPGVEGLYLIPRHEGDTYANFVTPVPDERRYALEEVFDSFFRRWRAISHEGDQATVKFQGQVIVFKSCKVCDIAVLAKPYYKPTAVKIFLNTLARDVRAEWFLPSLPGNAVGRDGALVHLEEDEQAERDHRAEKERAKKAKKEKKNAFEDVWG